MNDQSDLNLFGDEPAPEQESKPTVTVTSVTTQDGIPTTTVVGTAEPTPIEADVIVTKSTEPKELDTAEEVAFVTEGTSEDTETSEEIDIAKILKEQKELSEQGNTNRINMSKMCPCVPLSSEEHLQEHYVREIESNQKNIQEAYDDISSNVNIIHSAMTTMSHAFDQLGRALTKTDTTKLATSHKTYNDTVAKRFKQFEDNDEVTLSGNQSLIVMTALTGGMRRVQLPNSGFTVTLRSLPMELLDRYHREVSVRDYEYGKQLGTFYYIFADINIAAFIIENLLPIAICGSNYIHWKDTNKLHQAISWQDFHVLLWAMGLMLHPEGSNIHFICSEPTCRHVHTEKSDLSKLRLLNTDLINDDMIAHMAKTKVTDEDLADYREKSNLDDVITFEYEEGGVLKKWKIAMKQATLSEHLEIGSDYLAELQKHASVTNRTQVHSYTTYNFFRGLRGWIKSISLIQTIDGREKTFTVENGPQEKETYDMLFEVFQQHMPSFAKMVEDYILRTKITHIAFYMPKCPKCGTEPKTAVGGYVPYDPMFHFFTLALMKLVQDD